MVSKITCRKSLLISLVYEYLCDLITRRKIRQVIGIVSVSTMILSLYWGNFAQSPRFIKLIFSIGIWTAVITFPFSLLKKARFSRFDNLLLLFLLLMGIFQTLRSLFYTPPNEVVIGNKYVSLFFNEYTSLLFIPPLFTYLGISKHSPKYLFQSTIYYICIGLPFILLLKLPLASLAIYSIVFLPYVTNKYKILIILTILESILAGLTGGRMFLIVVFFAIMSFLLIYVIKNVVITYAFCVCFSFAPVLIISSTILSYNQDTSFFQKITSDVDNEEMSVDTRTFLYVEVAEDLTNSDSWLLGKGAYSHYYSHYFSQNVEGGDNEERLLCEVPFLLLLLRSGLIYVLVYFSLLLIGVFKSLKSNNKFVQSLGIIILGWYFNSFIGDVSGCKLQNLALFLLLGVCLSPKWRKMADRRIKKYVTI